MTQNSFNKDSLHANFKKKESMSKQKPFSKTKFSKTIQIWVPKTNNNLIRNQYINSFIDSVHKNKNFIFKGNSKPNWVWLPKI